MFASNNVQRVIKTKFKKEENEKQKDKKQHKHHDKSYYRLVKQEKQEYDI